MSAPDALESKIIKQVEYYFGDINLSRDKFMKEATSTNDGWISFETMLKFNRLKSLSEDIDVIKAALEKSTSGLIVLGPNGIRRNPEFATPGSFEETFAAYKGRCVYVKGFDAEATLDEIIEYLETHGGKTSNVHMRRFPKDRKFKGSVFAVFECKEDAEKFLASESASVFKDATMVRMMREDYWTKKKGEICAREQARAVQKSAANVVDEDKVTARMMKGALLELCGLPKNEKDEAQPKTDNGESEDADPTNGFPRKDLDSAENDEIPEGTRVIAIKQWITEKVGDSYPVAWVDVDPSEGKAVVRFRTADSAEGALKKLHEAFADQPITYGNCELSGRILEGQEELDHWKAVYAAQQKKTQRRVGRRQHPRGVPNKRRRMN